MPQPITQNVLILTTNIFDTLGIDNISIVPTPVATLPKENLQKEDAASKTRILSDNAIISLIFNSDTDINCIFLHDCNFVSDTIVNLKLFSDNNFTTEIYSGNLTVSSTLISGWTPCFAMSSFDLIVAKSAKISIINGDSYLDIGRLFIGKALQPTLNFSYGWSLDMTDPSIQNEMSDGSIHVQELQDYRRVSFTISDLDEDENNIQEWFNGVRYCGIKRQVVVSLFPKGDSANFLHSTFVGKFVSGTSFTQEYYRSFNASYEIRETIGGNLDPTLASYSNYDGCQESIIALQSQILSLNIQNESLQDTIDSLQAEKASLESEISRLTDYKIEYETRLEVLETCCTEVKEALTEANTTITTLNNKIGYIEASLGVN